MNGKTMDYVTFGKGKQPLVIIPGLGDGLQTVKGKAQLFSLSYRLLAKRYKIYVFLESMSWGRAIRRGIWQQM